MPHPASRFVEEIPLAEWAHLHAHLIWIYDGPVAPIGRTGRRKAPHLTAWLIRSGMVELRVRGLHLQAGPGEWLFPPAGEVWRHFTEDARILSVRYRASWPSGEELFSDGLGMTLPAEDYPELERTARPLAAFVKRLIPRHDTQLLNTPATLDTHLRLQRLFAAWLEASVRALSQAGLVPARMGRIDSRLLRAVQIVEKHILSRPFAERRLAAEIGLSVSQLNRLFRQQFGVTSHGYYERRRREYAVSALQGSSRTVKEIASELGFSSLPHFSAWTRRHLGQSPRDFRARRPV